MVGYGEGKDEERRGCEFLFHYLLIWLGNLVIFSEIKITKMIVPKFV